MRSVTKLTAVIKGAGIVFDRLVAAAAIVAAYCVHAPSRAAQPAPTIVSGTILTPTVNVSNQKSSFAVNFVVDAPGQYSGALFYLASPSGRLYSLSSETVLPGATHGTFRAGTSSARLLAETFSTTATELNLGQPWDYLEPGMYTLVSGAVTDLAGTSTAYTPSQLASLFGGGTITVVNHGKPDNSPPTLVSGTILTPTISLKAPHHRLEMQINVTDVSGVVSIEIAALFNGQPPPGYTSEIEADGESVVPISRGGVLAFQTNFAHIAPGSYTVFEILSMCDAAWNCIGPYFPADVSSIFGGKPSFVVTN